MELTKAIIIPVSGAAVGGSLYYYYQNKRQPIVDMIFLPLFALSGFACGTVISWVFI
jgi:hypothetical protein